MGTLITASALGCIVALIIRSMRKNKKKGKSIGCGCGCEHCGGSCGGIH